ncbi:MAG: hypothetical protein HYR49_01280 [Gammaproteobacteria bacterium]|nr:hypothetical protein [Gammaproteobacteria bacterium]
MYPLKLKSAALVLLRKCGTLFAVFSLCLAGGVPPVQADFDPVNDDTDIFLANPNIDSQRPNILIYLDNTANWNTAFDNEKAALVSVFNSLTEDFNVGMMMFVETGTGNTGNDGGYIRYAVRQMTPTNRSVLADLVTDFDRLDDVSNNNRTGQGMLEAHRYFSGGASRSSYGKIKNDFANNTTYKACASCPVTSHPATAANLGAYAMNANTAGTLFNSPVVDGCQSNFIIYIANTAANPKPSETGEAALGPSETALADLGYDTAGGVLNTGFTEIDGNWTDEWAKFMAESDIDADAANGDQHVFTYVVEVDPKTDAQNGLPATALWQSAATHGKGKYFGVSSANAGQAIINALNQIFQEVQAVNSVFASTTLPVSVNVRGTNLNQVYIGVFRPDEIKSPRWFGNLKMYQLGVGANALFLADAAGNPAENPESGFINPTSPSFWSITSDFWSFRDAELNGPGGVSDAPDGDLVEKGGAAQQQRIAYAADQSVRKLYTCTTGGSNPCNSGDLLSDTPFSTANDGITAAGLQLGVAAVSTLTGFDAKVVTNLTDTKTVTGISTAAGIAVTIDSLDNGASDKSVTSLVTTKTATISSFSNGAITKTITVLARAAGGTKLPITATVASHGYSNGQTVHISGVSASEYNGTFTISNVTTNTFDYNSASTPSANPNIASAVVATTTTNVTATTSATHSFSSGNSVVISDVSPTTWNGTYTIVNTTGTTFTFNTVAQLAPATTGGTARGPSTTATATVASHGYPNGSKVRISGATPDGYNGVFTISNVSTNEFKYTVASNLADATGTIFANQGSSTLVTAIAPSHGFGDGSTVSLSVTNADPIDFAGSFVISVVDADTFRFNTAVPVPANLGTAMSALSGTSNIARATAASHGFQPGESVIVDGVTGPDANAISGYNRTATILTVPDGNTFTYSTAAFTPAPATSSGTITARLSTRTAIATVPGHGYSTGNLITIKGALVPGYAPYNDEYNVSNVAITKIDNDTFRYPYPVPATPVALGTASGSITANIKTTTARVRAVAHGFATGNAVAIDTTPASAFEGTFTITVVDPDNFTYTLDTAQGDATGTITASFGAGSAGELTNLINWVRGADNFQDENAEALTPPAFDVRASIHGDVLHSRPAVVNYNRHGNDNDVYIFYGSNDGVFRAVKGGFEQSTTGEPQPGNEAWGFIPEEFFASLERMRNNEPIISSSNKKPYFADGTLGVFVRDVDDAGNLPGDGKLDDLGDADPNKNDKVWLFISMRRGGRFLYALDVSDPAAPKLLWRKTGGGDNGYQELGYTWSAPQVKTLNTNSGKPVLIFGAGYDPLVEDLDPAKITAVSATQVTAGALGTFDRSMGRGIYVLDAETGSILWQAGRPGGANANGTHTYKSVSGMDFAIPSDITVITDRNGTVDNRAYVGDTGGNMWRVDMNSATVTDWTVTKLATIRKPIVVDGTPITPPPSGLRKFLFPPDVVYGVDDDGTFYDAVLLGSGDREHPFDTTVVNRFYMFKDEGTGTAADTSNLVETDLFDATSNCIQDEDACTGDDTPDTALEDLADKDGWFITLDPGEKVVGNAVTLNNVTFFNTNVPSSEADADLNCNSDLGEARQYKVLFDSAEALADQNNSGSITKLDRFTEHPGGGYLPSPVPVVVEIDDKVYEGVISGVAVDKPPGSLLNARLRKFWYKEEME